MKTHNMQITPTDLRGVDSGRVRYRIVCTACGVLVHDATTGPVHAVRDHFEGEAAYERPLLDLERVEYGAAPDAMAVLVGPEKFFLQPEAGDCLAVVHAFTGERRMLPAHHLGHIDPREPQRMVQCIWEFGVVTDG